MKSLDETLDTEARRCVGKVMEQLDIIGAPEGTKAAIKRSIWALKDDISKEIGKHAEEGSKDETNNKHVGS